MSAGRRIGVVVNPERDALADEFLAGLGDVERIVERVDDPDELTAAVGRLVAEAVAAVAAVGGDGTQRTVAAALADTSTSLVVVPGGTVNLLGQVLGITTVDEAVAAARSGVERVIDLGETDGTLFTLAASSGWDASVIADADDGLKRYGRFGFTVAGLRQWVRMRPAPVVVTVDGERRYDGPAMTVMVMNVGQRASVDFDLAPDAEIDDGRLDVVVVRRHSFIGLLRTSSAILRGRPAPRREVHLDQGAEIEVCWRGPVAHQIDGDGTADVTEATYRARRHSLRVLCPPGE